MSDLIAILVVAGVGAAWYIDVRWHPWKPCPWCGGSRRNAGSREAAWGDCAKCGTTGKVRRFGAPRIDR